MGQVYLYEMYLNQWGAKIRIEIKKFLCEEKEKTYVTLEKGITYRSVIKKTELNCFDGWKMYCLNNDIKTFKEKIIEREKQNISNSKYRISYLNDEIKKSEKFIENINENLIEVVEQ